tara:strand:- start:4903 stop:5124 length:222 start_codon:yes stop_codon:yes gene_type:complete
METYLILAVVLVAWIWSGLLADRYALRKAYKEQYRLHNIMTNRYNFVVDMLNEEQQIKLNKWYVETNVIEEAV